MVAISSNDIRIFSDIGTRFEEISHDGGRLEYRFVMDADPVTLSIDRVSGRISFNIRGRSYTYDNPKALFASENFGNLRLWAANQTASLDLTPTDGGLSVKGELREGDMLGAERTLDLPEFNTWLAGPPVSDLQVVVIDDPAGIGKTTQIKRLAGLRARTFSSSRERLILHVESTGRSLQNLDDLIAGSLQKIRATPTFDQLRVLIRHGLITLAIDGFDELTDPSGYQLAWSQLRNLLEDSKGEGQIILSGRETFVSMSKMKDALPILESASANISEYRLLDVKPSVAREWLRTKGVSEDVLNSDSMNELLSAGSYGLRPFFISTIAETGVTDSLQGFTSYDILTLLVDAIVNREVSKFNRDIIDELTPPVLENFIRAVCKEIARDMADNQSEALPGQSAAWLAELCLPDQIGHRLGDLLLHRASLLPFLTTDRDRNSIRFSSRQYFVFFLGMNAIETLTLEEVPKYIRRSILGSEFLEAFPKALLSLSAGDAIRFRDRAAEQLDKIDSADRSRGNIAALVLSTYCEFPIDGIVSIENVSIDEVYLRGEVPAISLHNVTIGNLHAESANLEDLQFVENCYIVTMHVDDLTRFPGDLPVPSWLEEGPRTIRNRTEIEMRIGAVHAHDRTRASDFPYDLNLIDRILRYRPFWLRTDISNTENGGRRIVEHNDWADVLDWLKQNNLVRVEVRRPVSGPQSELVHFRKHDIRDWIGDRSNGWSAH